MTGFVLKIIALITMIFDHIKYSIPITDGFATQYFGRISFPLFAFLLTEGYIHTSNKNKYLKRLLLLAIISQIPFMLFRTLVYNKLMLNIIFTFLFAILGIEILEMFRKNDKINKFFSCVITAISFFVIAMVGECIHVDYGWFGILTIWIFYIFKPHRIICVLSYFILVILYYCSLYYPYINNINWTSLVFTTIPGWLILLYNGKEGKKVKYLFYIFYPVHMLILYAINLFI